MKRIVFFVSVLFAVAIANEEEDVKTLAEQFETNVQTVETCMQEVETNIMEIHAAHQEWVKRIKNSTLQEDLDEETREVLMKHGRFLACMLEKTDMMKDSKLVLDKILESIDSEKAKHVPRKEEIAQCVKELNEANEMNKEERALGLLLCFMKEPENNGEK